MGQQVSGGGDRAVLNAWLVLQVAAPAVLGCAQHMTFGCAAAREWQVRAKSAAGRTARRLIFSVHSNTRSGSGSSSKAPKWPLAQRDIETGCLASGPLYVVASRLSREQQPSNRSAGSGGAAPLWAACANRI